MRRSCTFAVDVNGKFPPGPGRLGKDRIRRPKCFFGAFLAYRFALNAVTCLQSRSDSSPMEGTRASSCNAAATGLRAPAILPCSAGLHDGHLHPGLPLLSPEPAADHKVILERPRSVGKSR